jgi:flavin-dependent dehydrogenase
MSARSELLDVIILGAGPAGSIAAATLARARRRVVCLERAYFPRFSIGESLLPRSNQLLAQAGLWDAVTARGYMEKRGAMFLRTGARERFAFAKGLPGEPPSTFQVPRDDFDTTLATGAREAGADVRFGHEVTSASVTSERATIGVRDVETGEPRELEGRFVIDASGPGRVLASLRGIDRPAGMPGRVALFTMVEGDVRPEGDEAGDIWVCISPNGAWIWIIPFSNGRTSVGVVAEPALVDAQAGSDRDKLWTLLHADDNARARLASACAVLPTRRLASWSRSVEALHGPGFAVAGNAGEFLDPVFSSGVTLAFESGYRAANLAHRMLEGEPVDWQAEYELPLRRGIAVFKAFVDGWYRGDVETIFFARNKVESYFRYVTSVLGGHVMEGANPLLGDPEGQVRRLARIVRTMG